jgi:diguanylate cyclase (GGDEF)-like protein
VIHQARGIYLPSLDAPVIPGDNKKWGSFIGAPMLTNNVVAGAIGLLSRRKEAFRQSDLKSLNILAAVFSPAFDSVYMSKTNDKTKALDPVTGTIRFRELLKKHEGMERNGAIAIVDLKSFTHVNEEFGLDGGDAVLTELARRIKNVVGYAGELSRFYGDRFIVALPGLTRRQTASMLQDVADSIADTPFLYKGTEASIIPVIGAALCPENGHRAEELLFKAQRAAQKARNTPGVRVLLYGDPDQPKSSHLKSIQ